MDSLSAEDLLLAWRRFVARRRHPARVRSDNATVFVASSKILPVKWVLNPPAAPWFGGFYERLVGSVKRPLKKVLGRALLRRIELSTVLCEIERAVNERPLTHVGDLLEDLPLTPARLMAVDIWADGSSPSKMDVSQSPQHLRQRVHYIRSVCEHFKRRWTREYLVTLNTYRSQGGQSRPVQQGDVVFVIDEGKRQAWKLARVTKLFACKDGKYRVASISTGGPNSTLRPIKRLVPLEVVDETVTGTGDPAPTSTAEQAEQAVTRTRTRLVTAPKRLNL